ncbi:MAG: hypothetical protein FJ288_13990, partial [Planctomycetes bacterium]|nr:hypothetical protein [Planctomycetota bacterium]
MPAPSAWRWALARNLPACRVTLLPGGLLVLTAVLAACAAGGEPWPGSRDGLVLAWPCANRPAEVLEPEAGTFRPLRLQPRGTARFGRFFEMDMRGGWFAAEGADAAVAAACRKTRQFALEMVITPADAKAAAAATILACGPAGDGANFRLLQDGDRLVLELRAAAGRPEPVTLATL